MEICSGGRSFVNASRKAAHIREERLTWEGWTHKKRWATVRQSRRLWHEAGTSYFCTDPNGMGINRNEPETFIESMEQRVTAYS